MGSSLSTQQCSGSSPRLTVTCTSSNDTPIEKFVGSAGGDVVDAITATFRNVLTILKRSPMPEPAPDARLNNIAHVLRPRDDTVECTSTEMCLSMQSVPFCLDLVDYTFHTGDGITGNALTGEYTMPDGRKGNMYTGERGASNPAHATAATTTAGAANGAPTEAGGGVAWGCRAATRTGSSNGPASTNGAGAGASGVIPMVGGMAVGLLGAELM